MIISILANGAPFQWNSGLEADQRFKSKTFKLYRKAANRANGLHSNMSLKIPRLNNSLNRWARLSMFGPHVEQTLE